MSETIAGIKIRDSKMAKEVYLLGALAGQCNGLAYAAEDSVEVRLAD